MEELIARIWESLAGRFDGPLHLRLIMQPVMAIIFAIRDGRKDARAGRVPYFWAIFAQATQRAELLRDGWKSIAKIFVAAIVMDVIYQLIVLHWIYPIQALFIAAILALVPYLLVRGPANRLTRRK